MRILGIDPGMAIVGYSILDVDTLGNLSLVSSGSIQTFSKDSEPKRLLEIHNDLKTIIEKFKGGPVGLNTIAATIGEEVNTLEDVYEPYLLQIGFIKRTNRGRMVTDKAYQHLNITRQETLF